MMRGAKLVLTAAIFAAGCSSDASAPSAATPCDIEGIAPEHCEAAHAMRLPATLAPSPGNRYSDNEDAAYLGFRLFFTTDLGTGVGCPTCHLPELAFTDRKAVSTGKGVGNRNSPTVFNAADLKVQFWDGRADSLWSQPLFAIEDPLEMASSRLQLAHFIADTAELRPMYEKVFGAMPAVETWPAAGKPGDEAFDSLPASTQDEVNRLTANVGKAFEAYMRKNRTSEAAFDRFLDGDRTKLIPLAQQGLELFFEQGCASCHKGPMLTDEAFHNVGFPSLPGATPDKGRAGALDVLRGNVFNLAGPYADAGPGVPATIAAEPGEMGAFRTPSLRNVTRTEPYGHDGALVTLREVLAVHAPNLDEDGTAKILALLQTLNGEYPFPPWNNWPSPQ
jgi:cytochrome c peroxidase